jgi:hypothetical protein
MAPHARADARDFPTAELLLELASEIDAAQPHDASLMLELTPQPCFPEPCTPCIELRVSDMERSSFVLSQKRTADVMYITVSGKRSHIQGSGLKKQRSTVPWPRTRRTDRLRPVSLHRWITFIVRGPPVSADMQASHVCDNDLCVAAAHLHWQSRRDNVDDRDFHEEAPTVLSTHQRRCAAALLAHPVVILRGGVCRSTEQYFGRAERAVDGRRSDVRGGAHSARARSARAHPCQGFRSCRLCFVEITVNVSDACCCMGWWSGSSASLLMRSAIGQSFVPSRCDRIAVFSFRRDTSIDALMRVDLAYISVTSGLQ